jgi:hypothetical protein
MSLYDFSSGLLHHVENQLLHFSLDRYSRRSYGGLNQMATENRLEALHFMYRSVGGEKDPRDITTVREFLEPFVTVLNGYRCRKIPSRKALVCVHPESDWIVSIQSDHLTLNIDALGEKTRIRKSDPLRGVAYRDLVRMVFKPLRRSKESLRFRTSGNLLFPEAKENDAYATLSKIAASKTVIGWRLIQFYISSNLPPEVKLALTLSGEDLSMLPPSEATYLRRYYFSPHTTDTLGAAPYTGALKNQAPTTKAIRTAARGVRDSFT